MADEMSGIEKLRSFADEAAELLHDVADQIELRHQLDVDAAVDETEDELGERLMPEGLEWPGFEDGERVEFGSAVDGLDSPCEKFIFTRSMGGVCQLQDADGNMVNVIHGERVKRPEPDVLAADGLPIKVGETLWSVPSGYRVVVREVGSDDHCVVDETTNDVWDAKELTHTQPDTQERIDAEIISDYRDSICPQLEPYTREYCTNECYCNSCLAERIMEQCDRQRELCAKGGE